MKAHRASYPIATMTRALGVSASGYYAWCNRSPSPRARADAELTATIRAIHDASRRTYGAPRIHVELRVDHGVRCGQKRVARLMRPAGLQGCHRRKKPTTTRRNRDHERAVDLVKRVFHATEVDRLWVADITYVPTWAGFLYLAVVLDAYSRKVVGWAMCDDLTTELVLDALDMALWQRPPASGLVHHSDSEYVEAGIGSILTSRGGHLHDVGGWTPPGFLTLTPIDAMSFLGTVGCPGATSEALASPVA